MVITFVQMCQFGICFKKHINQVSTFEKSVSIRFIAYKNC